MVVSVRKVLEYILLCNYMREYSARSIVVYHLSSKSMGRMSPTLFLGFEARKNAWSSGIKNREGNLG